MLSRLVGADAAFPRQTILRWKAALDRDRITAESSELEQLVTKLLESGSSVSWLLVVEEALLAELDRQGSAEACTLRSEVERLRHDQQLVRERLVESSADLAQAMARRYTPLKSRLDDATQEGYLGLLRAIDLFDPEVGIRFCTYATWWIRRAVTRDMLVSRTIRVPENILLASRRHRRCKELAHKIEGRALSEAEIAKGSGDSEKSVRHALLWGKPTLQSLDQPASDNVGSSPLAARLSDASSLAHFDKSEQRHTINTLLDKLTLKEANVIRAHYGLDGSEAKRFAQIGEGLNVSRETVRQIERRALLKLRQLATDQNADSSALQRDVSPSGTIRAGSRASEHS